MRWLSFNVSGALAGLVSLYGSLNIATRYCVGWTGPPSAPALERVCPRARVPRHRAPAPVSCRRADREHEHASPVTIILNEDKHPSNTAEVYKMPIALLLFPANQFFISQINAVLISE